MWIAVLLSVLVGAAIVVQNGANAHLMKNSDLWLLLAVGNFLTAATAFAIFVVQRKTEVVSEIVRLPPAVLIPGFCGLVITAGMPTAIQKLGVFNTVLLVIACQIIAGIAWDRFFADVTISASQIAGAALVFGGVLLILRPAG